MKERRELVDTEDGLSVRKQCDLLSIHRSGLYYMPLGEKPENLEIMRLMDEHYIEHPTAGVIRMQDMLFAMSIIANHKRARRLLYIPEQAGIRTRHFATRKRIFKIIDNRKENKLHFREDDIQT